MDIEVVSTHRKFYNIPSDVAALLLEAFPKVYSRIVREPAPQGPNQPVIPPAEPTFSLGVGHNGRAVLSLLTPSGECFSHQGKAEEADAIWRVWRGKKLRPSKELLERYRIAYERDNLPVGPRR